MDWEDILDALDACLERLPDARLELPDAPRAVLSEMVTRLERTDRQATDDAVFAYLNTGRVPRGTQSAAFWMMVRCVTAIPVVQALCDAPTPSGCARRVFELPTELTATEALRWLLVDCWPRWIPAATWMVMHAEHERGSGPGANATLPGPSKN